MKQIKTIMVDRMEPATFDRRVNAAIADGWRLVERFDLPGVKLMTSQYTPLWVAYLEKEVPDEDV